MTARLLAAAAACLCLAACLAEREHVVAPEAQGVVIDAATGQPVEGAQVRHAGLEGARTAVTEADGSFVLDGRTETRTILALPASGVFRDSAQIEATTPDHATGYGTAGFINGLGPARAEYSVVVLVFPADAGEVPLHGLTRDCTERPEQHHAMRMATYIASLDPSDPPSWLDAGRREALQEHLSVTLPSSFFLACKRMDEAYELYRGHSAALNAFRETGRGPDRR